MAQRQILLVSKFAEEWNGSFNMRVNELDSHIGRIDNKDKIEEATEVINVEKVEIVPLAHYKCPFPIIEPFSFYTIKN